MSESNVCFNYEPMELINFLIILGVLLFLMYKFKYISIKIVHFMLIVWLFDTTVRQKDEKIIKNAMFIIACLYLAQYLNSNLTLNKLEESFNSRFFTIDILGWFIPPYRKTGTHRRIVVNVMYLLLFVLLVLRYFTINLQNNLLI